VDQEQKPSATVEAGVREPVVTRPRNGLGWKLGVGGLLLALAVGLYLWSRGGESGGGYTPPDEDALQDSYILPDPLAADAAAAAEPSETSPGAGVGWQATLEAIAPAVASQAAALSNESLHRVVPRAADRSGSEAATSSASLAGRSWEVQFFKGNTVENYARQLDFFGIELGVPIPGGKILYAYNLAKLKPDTRTGPAAAENRCYLSWRRGDLGQAETTLFSQAGHEIKDRAVLKFLPPEIEAALAKIERGYAGEKADVVQKTRFGIRPKADGYDFYVMEQSYKPQPGATR